MTLVHHNQTINKFVFILLLALTLGACAKNGQYRVDHLDGNCLWGEQDCTQSIVETYPEFDLTFIEFTERGNLYDRASADHVLRHIKQQSQTEDGTAVFVFVHGWKHNAQFNDSNVVQFRDFLSLAAENNLVGRRKVIGVYLGWRGNVTDFPVAKDLSYWGRKSVAEEIGSGGVTEVFTQLHEILVQQDEFAESNGPLYKNTYVIIGHSFGGAIVLSALHDVLLKQIIAPTPNLGEGPHQCKKIKRFADALLLLNPAIEANRAILLKEAAARCQFGKDQPTLMHVLSSDGDTATKFFFPVGQYVNLALPKSNKRLKRTINGKQITLNERELDVVSVGNLKQIRTAYLSYDKKSQDWSYIRCREDLEGCGIRKSYDKKNHFPSNKHEPLSFIKTDNVFIRNHNDVFGCYFQSYISAVIFQTQSVDKGYINNSSAKSSKEALGCNHLNFDIKQCFNSQLDEYECEAP